MDAKQLADIQSEYKFLFWKVGEMRNEFIDIKGATEEYNRLLSENEKLVSSISAVTRHKEEIQKDIDLLSGYIQSVKEESERNTQTIIDIGNRENKIREENASIERKKLDITQCLQEIKDKSYVLTREHDKHEEVVSTLILKRAEYEKNMKEMEWESADIQKQRLQLQEYREIIEKEKSDIDKRNEELKNHEEEYKRIVLHFEKEKDCILSDIEKVNIKCSWLEARNKELTEQNERIKDKYNNHFIICHENPKEYQS